MAIFRSSEDAPSEPPVDIRVAAVDCFTLQVSWKPPLTEYWKSSDISGYYVGYKKIVRWGSIWNPYLFETVDFIQEQGSKHQLLSKAFDTKQLELFSYDGHCFLLVLYLF